MTTDVDVCNLAIDLLKEAPITALTDNRPIARWFTRNYPVSRDYLLKKHDWNFAMARVELPADATAPSFGWSYAYTLPSDCLRLVALTVSGKDEGNMIPHAVEQGKIMTDVCAPVYARYISNGITSAHFSPEFIQLLSATLAVKMAHWLTGKSSYQQIAQAAADRAMSDAWALDSIEGTVPRPAENEWIDAR